MSPVCSGTGKQAGRFPLAGLFDCIYRCCEGSVIVSQLESAVSNSWKLKDTNSSHPPLLPHFPGMGVWLRGWMGGTQDRRSHQWEMEL